MILSALSNIKFDEQDANLFLVNDAQLRADALKHSVLPRLRTVMNSAIALIHDIYGINALEDSIVSTYPNFRKNRENTLKIKYEEVFVGLGGQRKDKWSGFSRKDGKPVQILPFRFAFILNESGIFTLLENGWLKGLNSRSFEALLQFHIENENDINPLCFMSNMKPDVRWAKDLPLVAPIKDHYQFRLKKQIYDNHFFGHNYHFPVSGATLAELVENFACFFPIYDSYIQIAKGKPHRLDELSKKLSDWLQCDDDIPEDDEDEPVLDDIKIQATKAAEMKIRVMPAIRWQVFQRDQWKCVACGRDSHNGAILHVDHIMPRSKGGLDTLENFQTLCDTCNIGKSNRDATDLRSKS